MSSMIKKSLLTLAAASALSIAVIPCVSARQVGGAGGKHIFPSDASCFLYQNGIVTNQCGTTKAYEVQLPAETGNWTINFIGKGGVACSANVNDAFGTGFSTSGPQTASGSVFVNKGLGTLSLTSQGLLWLRCDFPANAALSEVNWN